jgi:outer membrane protein assembly factor BamA
MTLINIFLFALPIFLAVVPAFGSPLSACASDSTYIIESIEIHGNSKTKVEVIERELDFRAKDRVCDSQVAEGVQRLRNMGLFSSVEHRINQLDSATKDRVNVNVSVTEKWTTIPILKFNSGGGVTQYSLGTYDPNLFGEFIEAGAQYESLAGAGSGVAWFKNPRLFDQRQALLKCNLTLRSPSKLPPFG